MQEVQRTNRQPTRYLGRRVLKERRRVNPKSFSATALQVAQTCTARYKAEMLDRNRGFGGANNAATLGSAVHGALEYYVKATQIQKSEPESLEALMSYFKISYMQEFNTTELNSVEYFEGVEMLKKWFERTSFEGVTVISAEKKDNFPVKTTIGEKPFNYIWDRFDYLGNDEYRVVDYKTNKWGLRPEDLKNKIQARVYGMVAAMQLHAEGKTVKRIWVAFDMLRHDGMVGISFSRDENIATLKFIRTLAQKIIDTPENEVTETINNECLFCVRKQGCSALLKNVAVGGVHSLGSIEETVPRRAYIEMQIKALNAALREMDSWIIDNAKKRDELEFDGDDFILNVGMSLGNRKVDPDFAAKILGDELFEKYGGKSLPMAAVDKLLKGNEITAQQKSQLRGLITRPPGEPKVRITPKNPIDEE